MSAELWLFTGGDHLLDDLRVTDKVPNMPVMRPLARDSMIRR
jgi:hypothetical protein